MVKIEKHASRDEWLEARNGTIGASDWPTILGLNRFETPFRLAMRLRGVIPAKQETEAMRMGHRLEPVIAQLYADETGRKVDDPGEYTIHRNDAYPFLHASLDRQVSRLEKNNDETWYTHGSLELKAVGARLSGDWDEKIPLYVQGQVQGQLCVTDWQWGSVAALIGGQRFIWGDVERNQRFIDWGIERIEHFWRGVQNGELPEAGPDDAEALRLLWPEHVPEKTIELPAMAAELTDQLEELRPELAKLTEKKAWLENRLKQFIGDAERGILPDGSGWTYKSGTRKAYTVTESVTRTLRRVRSI